MRHTVLLVEDHALSVLPAATALVQAPGRPRPTRTLLALAPAGAMAATRYNERYLPGVAFPATSHIAIPFGLAMIIGNLAAITQDNIKRMLAYSSIGHAGYVLLGILAVTEMGLYGVLVYSVVYVFATLGIWTAMVGMSADLLLAVLGVWVVRRYHRAKLKRHREEVQQKMRIEQEERLRQERELFDQRKSQDRKTFVLRLAMGWTAVVLLLAICALCGYVVLHNEDFASGTVTARLPSSSAIHGRSSISRRSAIARRKRSPRARSSAGSRAAWSSARARWAAARSWATPARRACRRRST